MTTPNHPTSRPTGLWRWYTDANTAARDSYLNVTYHAHRMYLTGPWPDREAYQRVENTAWSVYYQASRDTWHKYTAALECPCCTQGGNDCTCPDDCGGTRCQAAEPPAPAQPTFTPGDAGHGLDQFDQRQETYLAADPNRRDQT